MTFGRSETIGSRACWAWARAIGYTQYIVNEKAIVPMNITLLVKTMQSGQVEASVLELPAYRVEADSRESAIASLKTTLLDKIQDAEALSWQFPIKTSTSPAWMKLAGFFEGNADFAEIMDEIQADRDDWGDEEMDESEYLR
jgi:hypothetical protein